MRVMIISTDYGPFLKSLYESDPALREASYEEQLRRRNETLFAGSDFYSQNFIALGHEAWEFHVNNGPLQVKWLKTLGQHAPTPQAAAPKAQKSLMSVLFGGPNALPSDSAKSDPPPIVRPRPSHPSPLRSPIEPSDVDLEDIMLHQVRAMRPDVILNQAVSEVESRVLERFRPYTKLIVGQIASPYPEHEPYSAYDLMISSLPNFVRYYRGRGLPAELNLLGFEPKVLDHVGPCERDVPLSFVGSITSDHGTRYNLIERLARETDIRIWGRLVSVPDESPIMKRYQGEAWGKDMFRALARSKITVNQHIDIAENYANNMRLFEATGMGALLITDWKDNIAELYEPGKEVVCYRSADECLELIRYYSTHDEERAAIAAAGQRRTLKDHSYAQVVADQVRIFVRALRAKAA